MYKSYIQLHFYPYTMSKPSIRWILYSHIVYEYKIRRILYRYTMPKPYFCKK